MNERATEAHAEACNCPTCGCFRRIAELEKKLAEALASCVHLTSKRVEAEVERGTLKTLLREFVDEVYGQGNRDGTRSNCSDVLWDKINAALDAAKGE